MRRNGHISGRQACRLSDYHMRLHNDALARVTEMRILKARGMSNSDIGVLYGLSASRVGILLKKYAGELA